MLAPEVGSSRDREKAKSVLDVVRAGYGLSATDREWLGALVSTAGTLLDRGAGFMAYTYDASTPTVRFGEFAVQGLGEVAFERLAECVARQDAAVQYRLYRTSGPFGSISQTLGLGERLDHAPFFRDRFHPIGVRDFLAMNATDPTGAGLVLCAPLTEIYRASAGARSRWARAAAHLAAAFRLRRALGATSPMVDAEAILTPNGRIEHAEGQAQDERSRDALERAAKVLEAALRRDAPRAEALREWTALVEGRWSVIDCFDSDGKRFLVARRNDPRTPSALSLTEQEAQVVEFVRLGHGMKLVAYELGLPVSTVAVLLERGMQKLGIRSRQELIAVMGEGNG
jgi:DNA-binding CsgD family transcriptional regulator